MKKLKYTSAVTRSVFGVFLWRGKILVGNDKSGRIAFPGGKMVPADKRRPLTTLKKECGQEVGKAFAYRNLLPAPLIFCTYIAGDHSLQEKPQGLSTDLRFIYLMEALNDKVVENQPEELKNPRFIDLAEFEEKQRGRDTRHTVGYAMEMFYAQGHLPEPDFLLQEPEPDNELIKATLLGFGFSPNFARDHSFGRPKGAKACIAPGMSLVAHG